MEKDFFKDRPKECTTKDFFQEGGEAFICLKERQKTASVLEDLTRIKINTTLTSQSTHPCGIKLEGIGFKRDVCGNIRTENNIPLHYPAIGRCVYPMVNNKVLTSNGLESVALISGKLSAIPREQLRGKCNLILIFNMPLFSCHCIIDPYVYYQKSELEGVVSQINTDDIITDGKYAFIIIRNKIIASPLEGIVFKNPNAHYMSTVFVAMDENEDGFIPLQPDAYSGIF